MQGFRVMNSELLTACELLDYLPRAQAAKAPLKDENVRGGTFSHFAIPSSQLNLTRSPD